jgi:hypothetical protein
MDNIVKLVVFLGILWLLPVLTIYSVNTLFDLSIEYTFKAWASTLWLLCLIGVPSRTIPSRTILKK